MRRAHVRRAVWSKEECVEEAIPRRDWPRPMLEDIWLARCRRMFSREVFVGAHCSCSGCFEPYGPRDRASSPPPCSKPSGPFFARKSPPAVTSRFLAEELAIPSPRSVLPSPSPVERPLPGEGRMGRPWTIRFEDWTLGPRGSIARSIARSSKCFPFKHRRKV